MLAAAHDLLQPLALLIGQPPPRAGSAIATPALDSIPGSSADPPRQRQRRPAQQVNVRGQRTSEAPLIVNPRAAAASAGGRPAQNLR